jgi:hypothetical protein
MTFEQFQATKQWSDDLSVQIPDLRQDTGPQPKGNVYLGCLYIEYVASHWPTEAKAQGEWYLILSNQEWITDDLTALERKLYDWAVSEGYFDPPAHASADMAFGPDHTGECPLTAADRRMAAEDDATYPVRDE